MINIKKILSILLTVITVITLIPTSVYALTWDGASSSGNNSAGSSVITGYAIRTSSDNCIGYRFSCVDANGNMKTLKVIDVFRNTGYGKLGYSDGYKFATKYNKKQLIAYQNSSFSTTQSSINCFKEADLGFSSTLPAPSGMGTWQSSKENINIILNKLNLGSVSNLAYGDKVIVEPIYDLMLAGTYHSVTVTEYSVYGKYFLGGGSDGGNSATSNTWGFISKFTNINYPNSLYTPDGQGLWTAASALSSRATFNTIIAKGYGVGIAYSETTNKTYTIKFNGNGATSGSMKNQAMTYNVAKNLTANAFQKTGNAFSKWNTKADGSGTGYKNKQSVKNLTSTNGGTVDLFAQWSPYKLTVYYNANGGVISSDKYYKGESDNIYLLSDGTQATQTWKYNQTKTNGLVNRSTFGLTRTGYSYNHWGTSPTSGKVYGQDDNTLVPTSFTSDINNGNCSVTVYAQWIPIQYNIVFNGNGNTSGSTASMVCTYDQMCNLTQNGFIKDGYHFVGWNTKPDGTGTSFMNQQKVLNLTSTKNETITLYAQWETNAYSIGFDGNGHTGGSTSGMTMKFEETKNLTANGYWKTGYTFKNWNTKADGSGAAFSNHQAVKNLTNVNGGTVILYAQWTPIEYTVRFDGNGNTSGSTNEMNFKYDESQNLNANGYLKTGYNFVGWNTQKNGSGIQYANKQEVRNLTATKGAVITLYAQWSPITYTVRFNGNGNTSGTMQDLVMIYNEAKPLTPNAYVKTSYDFVCWNTKADGTGKRYEDKQSVMNLTTTQGAVINLYAQWKFNPYLIVNSTHVYKNQKNDKSFYYGYSTGNTFNQYVYNKDYPSMNDTVWFDVYFPSEVEPTRVKQYVKTGTEQWQSRVVTLNGNDASSLYFPVQFSGKYLTIDKDTNSFVIEAKMDWIDANGNVIESGKEYKFYIPIEPTVHRYRVTAYGYDGAVATTSGDVNSGKLYAGQRVNLAYHYKMDNSWTAREVIKGRLTNSSNTYDALANVQMNSQNPVEARSSLNTYTVPITDKLLAQLSTAWFMDEKHTIETTDISVPVIKADVAITEIRLIDANTNAILDPNDLRTTQMVTVQYVYKNNSDVKIFVEGFKNDKTQIPGVFAIPPKSQVRVNAYTFEVPNERQISIWGGVYFEGMGIGNTKYESDGTNNEMTLKCTVRHPLSLTPIIPNADYREGTEVITSYWLNNESKTNYIQSHNVSVKFSLYKGNTLFDTKYVNNVIVPQKEKNLIYFKWTVPSDLNNSDITIYAEIVDGGKSYNRISHNYSTTGYYVYTTPDTKFEKQAPSGYTIPNKLQAKNGTATWWEWRYENGVYKKVNYGVGIANNNAVITPSTGSTAENHSGVWTMKSGYGISMSIDNTMSPLSGYSAADEKAYTSSQYCNALFPEYSYKEKSDTMKTLGLKDNKWVFRAYKNYGNVHFTPLWYPNGNYIVHTIQSDAWTPCGMITRKANTNTIKISESAYDDWYVGRE